MQTYEFDVITARHDDMKGGGDFPATRSRVIVSAIEYPAYAKAADVAACIAVAIHGGMPIHVLPRY